MFRKAKGIDLRRTQVTENKMVEDKVGLIRSAVIPQGEAKRYQV